MFKSLANIQSAFQLMRLVLLATLVLAAGLCAFVSYQSYQFAERQREKIYVLDGEQSLLMALSRDVNQNRMAEAKSHVRRFHEYFFTISPEKGAIEHNMGQALALADNSASDQYLRLKEEGFYDRVIAAGITCEIRMDSIVIDDRRYPYQVHAYGKTSIVRASSITFRNLETVCELVNCSRSEMNPHGFLVEKWKITDNTDIKVIER